MKPAQIKKRIEALEKKYFAELEQLADEILDARIIPYCQQHKLSFMMMNGIPRLVDESDEYVVLPKFMVNLFEISDNRGNRILWNVSKDYKYSGSVDFEAADQKHHDRKYKNRCLSSLIFSPAFG